MYSPTETVESKTLSGVRFTVRRLNVIQRAKRDLELVDARERYSDIQTRIDECFTKRVEDDGSETAAIKKIVMNGETLLLMQPSATTFFDAYIIPKETGAPASHNGARGNHRRCLRSAWARERRGAD